MLNNLGIFFNGGHPIGEIERITRLLNAKVVKMLCSDASMVRAVALAMPDVMVICRFWWQNDTWGNPNVFKTPNAAASLALDDWLRTCVNLDPLNGLRNVYVESMNEIAVAHGDDFAIKAGYMAFERERCYHHEKMGFHAAILNTGVGRDIDVSLAADYDLLKAVRETGAFIAVHGYGAGVGIDAGHGEFQFAKPEFNDLSQIYQHRKTRKILPVEREDTWLAFRVARLINVLRRGGYEDLTSRVVQTEFGVDDVAREYNNGIPYTSQWTPLQQGEHYPDGWLAWQKWWNEWGWLKTMGASEFYAEELAWGAAQLAEYGVMATVFADSTGEWGNFDPDGTDLYQQLARKLADFGEVTEDDEPPIIVEPPKDVYVTPQGKDYVRVRQFPTTGSRIISAMRPDESRKADCRRYDGNGDLWYGLEAGGYVASWVVDATAGASNLPDTMTDEDLVNELGKLILQLQGTPALIELAKRDIEGLR